MTAGVPGVDLALLLNVTRRLGERRLHAYAPGLRRSAAALVLRFDDDVQRTVSAALTRFRDAAAARARPHAPPGGAEGDAQSTATFSADFFAASSSRDSGHSRRSPGTASGTSASTVGPTDAASQHRTDPLAFFEFLAQQYQQHHASDHHHDHHREHAHGDCASEAGPSVVDTDAPSALQLLFLKRAHVDASRWSGQVAFPGGRRDPDDRDDFDTVCREAYETVGLPLQHHRAFLCLGRLPDWRLQSRVLSAGGTAGAAPSGGLVQSRFVFLHVGELTPAVHLATHEVESVRWVPLRGLTAAHVERGRVVHPLHSFVSPEDADVRLLLGEVLPNTYLTFPSVLLPALPSSDTASPSSTSAGAPEWRVWGLTLRSANELLALDDRQPFDWPLVESNSRMLRYGLLYPLHGFYEVLYQVYWCRAWLRATLQLRFHTQDKGRPSTKTRPSSASAAAAAASTWWQRVLHGSAMQRRYAVLPASADGLLFAAPERPDAVHVACLAAAIACAVVVLYTIAAVIAAFTAAVRAAVGVEAELDREARRQAYYAANTPSTVVRLTRHHGQRDVDDVDDVEASGEPDAASRASASAAGRDAELEAEACGSEGRLRKEAPAGSHVVSPPAAVGTGVPSTGRDDDAWTAPGSHETRRARLVHAADLDLREPAVLSASPPSSTSPHLQPTSPRSDATRIGEMAASTTEGTPADVAEVAHAAEIEAVMQRYRSTDSRRAS